MPQNTYPGLITTGGPLSVDELATQLPIDETTGQVGMWCIPNRAYSMGTVLATASTYYLSMFVARRRMSIIKMGFIVTTFSATNDNVDVGIYNAAGTRLTNTGATAGLVNTSNGIKTTAVPAINLTAGTTYYAAIAYGASAAPATLLSLSPASTFIAAALGGAVGQVASASTSNATLPASAGFGTPGAPTVALMVLEA